MSDGAPTHDQRGDGPVGAGKPREDRHGIEAPQSRSSLQRALVRESLLRCPPAAERDSG
jgi:hypothetical protein